MPGTVLTAYYVFTPCTPKTMPWGTTTVPGRLEQVLRSWTRLVYPSAGWLRCDVVAAPSASCLLSYPTPRAAHSCSCVCPVEALYGSTRDFSLFQASQCLFISTIPRAEKVLNTWFLTPRQPGLHVLSLGWGGQLPRERETTRLPPAWWHQQKVWLRNTTILMTISVLSIN